MASNLKLGTSARNAACNAIANRLNLGAGPGILKVFDDAEGAGEPANLTDQDVAILLADPEFSNPAFNGASVGAATSNAIGQSTVHTSGVAHYFRGVATTGEVVFQGLFGEPAEAPNDIELNNRTLVTNGTLAITGLTLTVAE